MPRTYLCNICPGELEKQNEFFVCKDCGNRAARQDGELVVYNDTVDKYNYFEEKVANVLEQKYANYQREDFLLALKLKYLWEMDDQNKYVGVAHKFWWEDHIGKIQNKRVLEIGCGANYLIPAWLEAENQLLAYDICKSSVQLAQKICKKAGVSLDNGTFVCADATTARFSDKFDIINVSNVLHHVVNRIEAFKRMHENLADNGKLLLVEPNYYYPPRWIVETDVFDPLNPVKKYFVENKLIEEDEKAIIFSVFKKELREAGFRIVVSKKDLNYAGYFSVYWLKSGSFGAKAIHYLDRGILQWILPDLLAPFEYIIAEKI